MLHIYSVIIDKVITAACTTHNSTVVDIPANNHFKVNRTLKENNYCNNTVMKQCTNFLDAPIF